MLEYGIKSTGISGTEALNILSNVYSVLHNSFQFNNYPIINLKLKRKTPYIVKYRVICFDSTNQ